MRRFLFIPLSIILICSCFHKLPEISYQEYIQTVNQLEKSNKYDEARELSYHAINKFPDNEFDIMKEIIYINGKTGNYDDNINLWKHGHEKGYFFFIHPSLSRYKPYLEMEEFEEIAARDIAMRDSANNESECAYMIITEDPLDDKERPLILIFHGGGSGISKAIRNWFLPERMMYEYEIAFVQSYRHNDFNTYGWGLGDSVIYKGVKKIFNDICKERNIDAEHVYGMGISAGAGAVIDIAANRIIDLKGIYAICPAMSNEYLNQYADKLKNISIAVLCGENDAMIERQREMFDILKNKGINAMFIVVKAMGHEFPENQEEHLNDALNFIIQ